MNNQKSQRRSSMMVRLVAILVVVMMFTMCMMSGTFAKYTSSATGSDVASVAKWDIKVNTKNIAQYDLFDFELFKTIKDSDGINDETDMSPVDGSIIAPGTSGNISIVIKNDSQVNAEYDIEYSVTNTNGIPVQFSLDGSDWKNDITELNVTGEAIAMNATKTATVYWQWPFNGNDARDTTLGTEATANIIVSAKVTATQVD